MVGFDSLMTITSRTIKKTPTNWRTVAENVDTLAMQWQWHGKTVSPNPETARRRNMA